MIRKSREDRGVMILGETSSTTMKKEALTKL